jgi:hypothetical protein
MKTLRFGCVLVGFLSLVLSISAQTSSSTLATAQVPPLIQFSNVATDEGGSSLSGAVSITFSLFNSQQGGEPLWIETQNNVQLDPTGHYTVQLGITKPAGVPTTLFTSGEARWLGVRIAEQVEQPRVLLLSVPYALKAGDAATIGGLPPSAFMLAAPSNGAASAYATESATEQTVSPATATDVTTTGGTANFLPVFNGTSTIIDSVVFQSGTGSTARIGINNPVPANTLDVEGGGTIRGTLSLPAAATATATAGGDSQGLAFGASAFNSSTSKAVNQSFRWQAEPAGNDTPTPSATLNLLFHTGTLPPAETGLSIASNGALTFITTQILPGADVTGDLGDSGQIVNINATNIITAPVAQFSSSLLVPTINATANITAGGTVAAAAVNTTGNILAGGTIGSAGVGNFGSVVSTGNVSSDGAITSNNFSGPNAASFVLGSFSSPTSEAALQVENVTTTGEVAFLENGNASNPFSVLKLLEVTGSTGDFLNCERPDGTELCNIDSSGTFHSGSDFAEALPARGAKELYEPGDVLVMTNSGAGVEKTSARYSRRVIGIYSTRPGFVGAEKNGQTRVDKNDVPVAITGIVPAKVSAENGPVRVGDLLVTASTPGYAMKATDPRRMAGAIVGKAMEPLLQGAGVIRVLVTTQ